MDITICKGRPEELTQFVDLLAQVRQGMEHKDWFFLDDTESFQTLMDSGSMHIWFAMDGDRLAGALDILLPGLDSYNYGYELDYSTEKLLQVVNIDSAAVHPDYRGQGIQRRLLQEAESWMGREQRRILLCTIHPDNRFSLNNALQLGYEIQAKIPIYGSVRYLLKKEIEKSEIKG